MADQTNTPFLRSVLSGPDGTGSTARFCTLIVIVFASLWVTYLVWRQTAIPPLAGLTVYVTTVIACLYGTNKVTAFLAAKKADCDEQR